MVRRSRHWKARKSDATFYKLHSILYLRDRDRRRHRLIPFPLAHRAPMLPNLLPFSTSSTIATARSATLTPSKRPSNSFPSSLLSFATLLNGTSSTKTSYFPVLGPGLYRGLGLTKLHAKLSLPSNIKKVARAAMGRSGIQFSPYITASSCLLDYRSFCASPALPFFRAILAVRYALMASDMAPGPIRSSMCLVAASLSATERRYASQKSRLSAAVLNFWPGSSREPVPPIIMK